VSLNYSQLYQAIQDYSENTESLFVANIPRFTQEAEERIYNSVQIPSLRKNVTGTLTASNPYLSAPNDYLSTFSMAVIKPTGAYEYLLNKDVNYIRQAYPNPSDTGEPRHYALFGSQYSSANELSFIVGPTPDVSYNVELHYYYYPISIVQGVIATLENTSLVGGINYTNGVYPNVALTGGTGNGAIADIVVSGNAVTSVTIKNGGSFYVVGNSLSAAASDLGTSGTGSGFSIPVATINNATGTSWLGDNYDPVLLYGTMREAMIFMKAEADMVNYYEQKYQEALQQLNRLGTGLERGDAYRDGQAKIKVNP
jgi:hypothetical protein